VDIPRHNVLPGENGDEIALVLKGFEKGKGEIGPIYVARVHDQDGEPIGYRELVGEELLFNAEQQTAFERLGQTFTTGEAKRIYGKQDQATSDFLKKLVRIGLAQKIGRGLYRKTALTAERVESVRNS